MDRKTTMMIVRYYKQMSTEVRQNS